MDNKSFKLKTYKDLIAWQKSYGLCLTVFKMANSFPKKEQFGLVEQMKRSALSVPSNIAEGYTRGSTQEYIRFLNIAYSSLAELETQLLLSKDLNYICPDTSSTIFSEHNEIQRIMRALIKSLKDQHS